MNEVEVEVCTYKTLRLPEVAAPVLEVMLESVPLLLKVLEEVV